MLTTKSTEDSKVARTYSLDPGIGEKCRPVGVLGCSRQLCVPGPDDPGTDVGQVSPGNHGNALKQNEASAPFHVTLTWEFDRPVTRARWDLAYKRWVHPVEEAEAIGA